MRNVKFNQVWAMLLIIAALSAFVISPRATDQFKGLVQYLFYPIARPVRALGLWAHGNDGGGPQSASSVENEKLKLQVMSLSEQILSLQRTMKLHEALGDAANYATPARVIGADSSNRESLMLGGSFDAGAYVLYAGGLAGRIENGSRVRLITDPGFRVQGHFGRFNENGDYESINSPPPMLEGVGNGTMVIRNLSVKDVEASGIKVGDLVSVDDRDYPRVLRGYKIGKVVEVTRRPDAPLFAEIRVKPSMDLMGLDEVMVMR